MKTAVRYGLLRHQASHDQGDVEEEHKDTISNKFQQHRHKGHQKHKSNDFKGMTGTKSVLVADDVADDMAWAFQDVVSRHLQQRLNRAIEWVECDKNADTNQYNSGEVDPAAKHLLEISTSTPPTNAALLKMSRREKKLQEERNAEAKIKERVAMPGKVRHVVICGGVASNKYLRNSLTQAVHKHGYVQFYFLVYICKHRACRHALMYLNAHTLFLHLNE